MVMINGSCLCEQVKFSCNINHYRLNIYQCHCTLCKKQSGSSSNSATMVKLTDFQWLQGEDNIGKWQKETGFSAHFCQTCGCVVPNVFADSYVWIPIGLLDLDKNYQVNVVADLCLSSQSQWHLLSDTSQKFEKLPPDLTTLLNLLEIDS